MAGAAPATDDRVATVYVPRSPTTAVLHGVVRTRLSEFLAAVDTALQRIGDDPLQFPVLETLPDEPSVRRFLLKRFPYTIIYEVVSPEIQVLAVAHVRRRPQYWKKRH